MESDYLKSRRKNKLSGEKPKKKTYIRSVSKKTENRIKEYSKLRKQFLVNHPRCQVKGCNHVSEHIHHKAGRIGDLLVNTEYFLAVCAYHHIQIETHPLWAKEQGYSLSRLNK